MTSNGDSTRGGTSAQENAEARAFRDYEHVDGEPECVHLAAAPKATLAGAGAQLGVPKSRTLLQPSTRWRTRVSPLARLSFTN